MYPILWFLQPQTLGISLHFFCFEASNCYASSSIHSYWTIFTSRSSSSTTDSDSELSTDSETTEARGFLHDMPKTLPSCKWCKNQNYQLDLNFYNSYIFFPKLFLSKYVSFAWLFPSHKIDGFFF